MKNNPKNKTFDFTLLKRVFAYTKKYSGLFVFTATTTVLLAVLAPIRPYIVQYIVDHSLIQKDYQQLVMLTILMIGILIIESLLQYFFIYNSSYIAQGIIKDIRKQLFDKIIHFKLSYFDKSSIGQLVTRVISDIEVIAEVFSEGFLMIIGDVLKLLFIIGFMFYINWSLTLIVLIPIPLLIYATVIFKKVIKEAYQEVRKQAGILGAFVQEHIVGMNIVQVFNREKVEYEKFKAINKQHMKAHIKTVWAYSVFFPVVEILSAISIALLVWWGFKDVIKSQNIEPGIIFSFILYIYMLYRPIRQLADRFNTLQRGMVGAERVFKILDTDASIENNGTLDAKNIEGNIEFKNVWFAYNDEDWILKDLCLSIKKGENIAFVGSTGAGKTTLINLLGRYYDINKGDILIDNHSVKDYELYSLRKSMTIVMQDVFLFSDTIFNNITLNNPEINRNMVIEAAKKIGAHDFISQLPNGYDYNVKERGSLLSVGQRQLIAFIRAYVHNPKILILDEATSSVDSESEALIQHATEIITKNRTSIIVAHRLSTIQNADKIVVMEKGKIIEMGNHFELIKNANGHYKKLYELQFKELLNTNT